MSLHRCGCLLLMVFYWPLLSCDGEQPPQSGQDAGFCTGRPRLVYSAAEAARLRAFGEDDQPGSLGVSPQTLLNERLASGRGRSYAVESIPAARPERLGDAKSAAEQALQIVRWAGFMRYIAADDRHVAAARQALLRVAEWSDWGDNDLTVAALVRAVALGLDWFCEDFTASERSRLAAVVKTRGVSLLQSFHDNRLDPIGSGNPLRPEASPNHKMSNAAAWGSLGLALEGHDEDAAGWVDSAIGHAEDALVAVGGDDGGPAEGVSYGSVTSIFLEDFDLDVAALRGVDVTRDSGWVANFPAYILQAVGPGNYVVNFNDSGLGFKSGYVLSALQAVYHAGDSEAGQLAQGLLAEVVRLSGTLPLSDPSALRYLKPTSPAASLASQSPASAFESVGQVVVRTSWEATALQLAFRSQSPSAQGVTAHRHYDAGQLVLNLAGDLLLTDPGYAIQSFLEGQISDDFLEQLGCGATTDEKLVAISTHTLRTPGHNTITLERTDGSLVTQRAFVTEPIRHELDAPRVFVAAEFGDTYRDSWGGVPLLDQARRRVLAWLPHAILVHDRIIATPELGAVRARFHFNARTVDELFGGLQDEPDITLTGGQILLTPAGAEHRLRIEGRGYPDLETAVDGVPTLACLGEYALVRNATASDDIELFTLLLPEAVGAPSPILTWTEDADSVGISVERGCQQLSLRLARGERTFDPGDASQAIGLLVLDDCGAPAQTFVVRP